MQQLVPHHRVRCILPVRPIHRDGHDAVRPVDDQGVEGVTRHGADDTDDVGFNPYRKFKAKPADIVFVVVGVAVAIALVAWAFFG
jgi:hypothetical protein